MGGLPPRLSRSILFLATQGIDSMTDLNFGEWQDMSTIPRDGTRVLVEIRASEQGGAEVDMVRWAKPDRLGEACWMAVDSDPDCVIAYEEAELRSWMPLPTPLPKLRSSRNLTHLPAAARTDDEIGGSGI